MAGRPLRRLRMNGGTSYLAVFADTLRIGQGVVKCIVPFAEVKFYSAAALRQAIEAKKHHCSFLILAQQCNIDPKKNPRDTENLRIYWFKKAQFLAEALGEVRIPAGGLCSDVTAAFVDKMYQDLHFLDLFATLHELGVKVLWPDGPAGA